MTDQNDNHVKILFNFYSDVLDEQTIETMWAKTVDSQKGLYKIDNIPFYASIAADDIVLAAYDEIEQMLTYRKTVEYSGNSTVQVVLLDKNIVTNDIRDILHSLGCETEKLKEGYFVINVPSTQDYTPIKNELMEMEKNGIIEYAEPWLSEKHWDK